MDKKTITNENMSFEQAMQRLEEIVAILEKGDAPLNQSVELFEEGTRLSALCNSMLQSAQQKITDITKEQ